MRFGQVEKVNKLCKVILPVFLLLNMLFINSCKEENANSYASFKFPEQGQAFDLGEEIKVELDLPAELKVTTVKYSVDGNNLASNTNGAPMAVKTADLTLGYKLITAEVVKENGEIDTLTVNIELRSRVKPDGLTYKVINTYPHDTASYTQGLEYHNEKLLESTGQYGASTLRWVDLQTGKTLNKIGLTKNYFAEGAALIGDKIILLTWKENVGFVYDSESLKQLSSFPYQNSREGWGLTSDGKQLIKSDGTNRIWFLNKDNYQEERYIDVYDNNGQVSQLNELEYIDGKIYSNIYQTDKIAVIDPGNGVVLQYIDLTGILPLKDRFSNTDVLNGIAWDAKGKRLFVTGKKYDKLFNISLVPSD